MPILNSYQRTRLLLVGAVVACFLVFWLAGGVFHIPYFDHQGASLFQMPGGAVSFLAAAVVLFACTALGTLVAGTIRFDAGLFAAAAGLSALSMRGGPMREVLRTAANAAVPTSAPAGIFLELACELALLYALVGVAWSGLWLLHGRGWLKGDEFRDGVEDVQDPLPERLYALLTQAGVCAVGVLLLARSDAKPQVLIAVGVSSFVGTLVAHSVFPIRPSAWFWAGPLLVGLVGYVGSRFKPDGWVLGDTRWMLAPLARPLPLDYASFGPAGAIFGYWTARRWQRAREEALEEEKAATATG